MAKLTEAQLNLLKRLAQLPPGKWATDRDMRVQYVTYTRLSFLKLIELKTGYRGMNPEMRITTAGAAAIGTAPEAGAANPFSLASVAAMQVNQGEWQGTGEYTAPSGSDAPATEAEPVETRGLWQVGEYVRSHNAPCDVVGLVTGVDLSEKHPYRVEYPNGMKWYHGLELQSVNLADLLRIEELRRENAALKIALQECLDLMKFASIVDSNEQRRAAALLAQPEDA